MDNIEYIIEVLEKFIETFTIKYEYCNIGIIKKFRIDSRKNLEYDEAKWCSLFLKKSCLNYCSKILLIKIFEDTGKITCKINEKGIKKWNMLVKNIKERYDKLYDIAVIDIKNEEENSWIKDLFVESNYDIYGMDKELAKIIIDSFSKIDFKDINNKDLNLIFRAVYPLDSREENRLEEFYTKAPALDYMMGLKW